MDSFLLQYLAQLGFLKYIAAFFLMTISGDETLFAFSFLTRYGVFVLEILIFPVLLGTLVGDMVWYFIGKKYKDSRSIVIKVVRHLGAPFDKHLRCSPLRTLLISKFVYGVHRPLLFRAGALGLPFRNIFQCNLIASFCWVLLIGGVGYTAGSSAPYLKHYVRWVELILLAGMILYAIASYIISVRLRRYELAQKVECEDVQQKRSDV